MRWWSSARLRTVFVLTSVALAGSACREPSTIEVTSLSFQAVKAIDESRLKSVLATTESSWLPWGRKRYFDRVKFDADLKRVEAFYADRGYPEARVTSFDVKLNDKQDQVAITIVVSEGEPTRVAAIAYEGFEAVPERHLRDLESRAPLRSGEPLDRQLVVATRELAANELKDHGYPYATVVALDEPADAVAQTAGDAGGPPARRVTFQATPGPIAYFGPVEIGGNASVGDSVIRRQLTFHPGDLFRRSQVQDSQRRLYALELFQFANVEVVNPEREPTEVPIRVTVAEGKHRKVNFGVGYGTEEKGRADVEWRHLNFFGDARSAGVHAKWSSLDRGVRMDFTQPYFFRPHFSLGLEGQAWYANEPAFASNIYGGRATVTHRANQQLSWSLSFVNEFEQTAISNEALSDLSVRELLISLGLDPRTGTQEGTLAAVAFDLQRNTTTNLLNATSGYVASLHLEDAGRLLPGTYTYYSLSGEGRHYWSLVKRLVLANRVQLATIDPARHNDANVPFSKRYFLGGSSSIRGWGRFEVSPLSGSGLPLGGFSLFQATSEVRVPIAGKLGAVAFIDAGNVWSRSWDVNLGDLRYAVGPGLRYLTPIGPIRVDVGYQLNPIASLLVKGKPEPRHFRVHFSIGQAF